MTILINTRFTPFRLALQRREPVTLSVEIVNKAEKEKLVSFELLLTRFLSLDKSGLKNGEKKFLGPMKPNERKTFYFDIFPKQAIRPGIEPIKVRVLEHFNDYNYIAKENAR